MKLFSIRSVLKSGIPYFWLTVLKSIPSVADMIHDHDEPILAYLMDVKVKMNPDPMVCININKFDMCK